MKRKTAVWILLSSGVIIFVLMSLIIYNLVPATESIINYMRG